MLGQAGFGAGGSSFPPWGRSAACPGSTYLRAAPPLGWFEAAFREGRIARVGGVSLSACPYTGDALRGGAWILGWGHEQACIDARGAGRRAGESGAPVPCPYVAGVEDEELRAEWLRGWTEGAAT